MTECPYCGEKLLYLEAFLYKNRSFYECKCCKHVSEINIKNKTFKILGLVELLAILIFAISVFVGGTFCLWGLLLILLAFFCFYVFSPFSVRLIKLRKKQISNPNAFLDTNSFKYPDSKTEEHSERDIYSN